MKTDILKTFQRILRSNLKHEIGGIFNSLLDGEISKEDFLEKITEEKLMEEVNTFINNNNNEKYTLDAEYDIAVTKEQFKEITQEELENIKLSVVRNVAEYFKKEVY